MESNRGCIYISTKDDGLLAYTGTLSQIFKKGGFRLKMIVKSGETNPEALKRMGRSVLGHKWSPTEDVFTFQPNLYMGKKTSDKKWCSHGTTTALRKPAPKQLV